MKVSTMKKNQKKGYGVISFLCGPEDDKEKVVSCGKNLLKHIPYVNESGEMFYKTRSKLKASYKIDVSKPPAKKPSEVFDKEFISCINKDLENKWGDYPIEKSGKWMMFFKKEDLDEKWELAKKCYLERKLDGISSIQVSTMMKNES